MSRALVLASLLLAACSGNPSETATTAPTQVASTSSDTAEDNDESDTPTPPAQAHVVDVTVSGDPGSYTFAVTLESPDTGCDQYADWWEVLDQDGNLLYRRILGHSHVDEQPFTRTGGPVDINADQVVFVRAHMNVDRYGGDVFMGTVDGGFGQAESLPPVSSSVESAPPQPTGCAF